MQTLPPEIKTENAHFIVRKIQLNPNAEDGYVSESERFPSQVTYDISEFLLNGAVSQKNHLRLITDLILQSAPHGDNIFRHKFAGYLMNRQASIDAFSIITPEPGIRDELAAFILHKRQQAFLINIADASANDGHLTTRIEDLEVESRVKTSLDQLGIKTLTILNLEMMPTIHGIRRGGQHPGYDVDLKLDLPTSSPGKSVKASVYTTKVRLRDVTAHPTIQYNMKPMPKIGLINAYKIQPMFRSEWSLKQLMLEMLTKATAHLTFSFKTDEQLAEFLKSGLHKVARNYPVANDRRVLAIISNNEMHFTHLPTIIKIVRSLCTT